MGYGCNGGFNSEQRAIDDVIERARQAGVEATREDIDGGDASSVIVEYVEAHDVDLVVMGPTGGWASIGT